MTEAQKISNRARAKQWYHDNKDRKKAYDIAYNAANRDKKNAQSRSWVEANPDKRKVIVKKEYEKNKKKKFKYHSDRLKQDIQYRLRCTLRSRLSYLKRNGSSIKDLGCSVADLKRHLENQFQPGMTWNNWSLHGWHIDHIKPLVSFDLLDRTQFLEACNYKNLQPLWAKDNQTKGSQHG